MTTMGFEGRGRVTTADERVERVGCMMRRSEMDEGSLPLFPPPPPEKKSSDLHGVV